MQGDLAGGGYLPVYPGEPRADLGILDNAVNGLPDIVAAAVQRVPDVTVLHGYQQRSLCRQQLASADQRRSGSGILEPSREFVPGIPRRAVRPEQPVEVGG